MNLNKTFIKIQENFFKYINELDQPEEIKGLIQRAYIQGINDTDAIARIANKKAELKKIYNKLKNDNKRKRTTTRRESKRIGGKNREIRELPIPQED